MMIMRWCTVQTNEYDLQAKIFRNICTHRKLQNRIIGIFAAETGRCNDNKDNIIADDAQIASYHCCMQAG